VGVRPVRRFLTRDVNGVIDASAVNGPECYRQWLDSRSEVSVDPAKSFQRCLTAHLTGSDGRQPFQSDEEEAILRVVRLKCKWPAFAGTDLTIGLKGFRAHGFHEKIASGVSPRSAAASSVPWSPGTTMASPLSPASRVLKRKVSSEGAIVMRAMPPPSARLVQATTESLQRMHAMDKPAKKPQVACFFVEPAATPAVVSQASEALPDFDVFDVDLIFLGQLPPPQPSLQPPPQPSPQQQPQQQQHASELAAPSMVHFAATMPQQPPVPAEADDSGIFDFMRELFSESKA